MKVQLFHCPKHVPLAILTAPWSGAEERRSQTRQKQQDRGVGSAVCDVDGPDEDVAWTWSRDVISRIPRTGGNIFKLIAPFQPRRSFATQVSNHVSAVAFSVQR